MKTKISHLIIGCGYLGKRLKTFLKGQTVWATNRSELTGNNSILLDINDENTCNNLAVLSNQGALVIYFMVPPSKIEQACFIKFINRLNQLNILRAILVSSTVVYGNKDRIVDANSEVELDGIRAECQYQIEKTWSDNIDNAYIVRLAGIYGPDRIIGLNAIKNGEMINGDPEGWLNFIYVDDAANLIKCIGSFDSTNRIELGCDGMPIKRKEYYSFLARLMNQAPPRFNTNKAIRGKGRRCDNKLTISRTGWQPEYTDGKQAISKLING